MTVRVHELAREFQVESKVILAALKDMGEYIRSASSTVEAPVVRRLYDFMNSSEVTSPQRKAAPRQSPRVANNPFSKVNRSSMPRPIRDSPFSRRSRPTIDPNLIEAARIFGVSPSSLRSTEGPKSLRPRPTKSGTHELDRWDELLMDRRDRKEWIDAGLGDHDARIADSCRSYGITPNDLSLVVEGRPVWDRLRSNESITIIADMIRVQKERHSGVG